MYKLHIFHSSVRENTPVIYLKLLSDEPIILYLDILNFYKRSLGSFGKSCGLKQFRLSERLLSFREGKDRIKCPCGVVW